MLSKKALGLLVILFLTGVAVGRFTLPSKIVEKEKIVFQDRIIEKKIEVSASQKKNNKVYTKVEKILPDGTKTIESKIVNQDVTVTNNKTNQSTDTTISQTTEKEKTITYSKQDMIIAFGMSGRLDNLTGKIGYGGIVEKRLIGPIYIGVMGYTDRTYGFNIGLGF